METGGGGESGGYKGRKDAIKSRAVGRPERKIPLPGHHDHAEGTVEIMIMSSSFGNSFVFGCLRLSGLFQAFINPVLKFLTLLFEP